MLFIKVYKDISIKIDWVVLPLYYFIIDELKQLLILERSFKWLAKAIIVNLENISYEITFFLINRDEKKVQDVLH